jgi:type I restriction enzyme S subunit
MIIKDRLVNLTENITDGEHSSVKNKKGSNYYLLSNNNIEFEKIHITEKDREISKESFLKIRNRTNLAKNDIVIGTVGTLGNSAIIEESPTNYDFQRNVGIIKCDTKLIHPRYMFYFFQLNHFKKQLNDRKNISAQGAIYISDLKQLEIDYFKDLKYQKKVSDFFYNIDRKIDLNEKINSTLENMAKKIYDYWFVQYDFPNDENKPYKSSGGKMVWSNELGKEIPKNWKVVQLNDIAVIDRRKVEDTGNYFDMIALEIMPNSSICINNKILSSKYKSNLYWLDKYDILFGEIRPYLKKAGFSPFKGVVSGSVQSYKPKKQNDYYFTLLTLTHDSVFNFAISGSGGKTRTPSIDSSDLLKYKIAYNENISENFNKLLEFKELIAENINENYLLKELKKFLLPLIMNGQILIN